MKYPEWYTKIIIGMALALLDHIDLKVVRYEKEIVIRKK